MAAIGIAATFTTAQARADIPGACCLPDGSCEVVVNWHDCEAVGGTFAGFGVTCDNAGCVPTEVLCDTPLVLSACPGTIVFETESPSGVIFSMPNPPTSTGCDPVVTVDPPLGTLLAVGEHTVTVIAEDAHGEFATCEFTIVVDFVDEEGPILKRRIKGGGNTEGTTPGMACGGRILPSGAEIGGPLCGICPASGLVGAFAALGVGRRRACRKSRRPC